MVFCTNIHENQDDFGNGSVCNYGFFHGNGYGCGYEYAHFDSFWYEDFVFVKDCLRSYPFNLIQYGS